MNILPELDIKSEALRICETSNTPVTDVWGEYLWQAELWEKANKPRTKEYIHASDLSQCMRCTVLKQLGMVKPQREDMIPSLRIFINGKYAHHKLQYALAKAGILFDMEKEVFDPTYRVGGSIDGKFEIRGRIELAEIKSINSFSFSKKDALPLKEHKIQMTAYMLCEEEYRGRFIYECKNTQKIKEIVYSIEDEIAEKVLERSMKIWKYVDACKGLIPKEMPLPQAPCILPNQPEAQRCFARQTCFSLLGVIQNGF